jgi:hypothetical protein
LPFKKKDNDIDRFYFMGNLLFINELYYFVQLIAIEFRSFVFQKNSYKTAESFDRLSLCDDSIADLQRTICGKSAD